MMFVILRIPLDHRKQIEPFLEIEHKLSDDADMWNKNNVVSKNHGNNYTEVSILIEIKHFRKL